jgi:hypothetical protein
VRQTEPAELLISINSLHIISGFLAAEVACYYFPYLNNTFQKVSFLFFIYLIVDVTTRVMGSYGINNWRIFNLLILTEVVSYAAIFNISQSKAIRYSIHALILVYISHFVWEVNLTTDPGYSQFFWESCVIFIIVVQAIVIEIGQVIKGKKDWSLIPLALTFLMCYGCNIFIYGAVLIGWQDNYLFYRLWDIFLLNATINNVLVALCIYLHYRINFNRGEAKTAMN